MATTTAPKLRPTYPMPHRFTVTEFEALLDTRPFVERPDADDRFELVDGCIYDQPPMNDPHWLAVQTLMAAFAPLVASRRLLVNAPVIISNFDEPLPDLAVVRADFPFRSKPRGQDLLLVIEVSDRSRREYDRHTKLPRYQAAGVREVWIVDLVEQAVFVWASPESAPTARHPRGHAQQATPALVAIPVDVDALFAAADAGTTPR
jgi:Uma2 family endonuclease